MYVQIKDFKSGKVRYLEHIYQAGFCNNAAFFFLFDFMKVEWIELVYSVQNLFHVYFLFIKILRL